MCIFSGPVEDVGGTSIFCADLGSEHATVYEMSATITTDLAMILPVPIRPGGGEKDLRFVNLEDYPDFFMDMDKLFPAPVTRGGDSFKGGMLGSARSMLEVQQIGQYEATFVPSVSDLNRLDPRFKLPELLFEKLPDYSRFGFAVFKLKPTASRQKSNFHPMAYTYPPDDRDILFYPTIHVHDGAVKAAARYDHKLYFQRGGRFGPCGWPESAYRPAAHVKIHQTAGLVREDQAMHRLKINGFEKNRDVAIINRDGKCEQESRMVRG